MKSNQKLFKKVILLTQSIEDVPFDLRHLRCIEYDNTPRGAKKLKQSLIETLKSPQEEKPIPFRVVKKMGDRGSGPGEFNGLRRLAVGKEGRIYVSDKDNHRIQKFDHEGNFLLKWGPAQYEPGHIHQPHAIAIYDSTVYVTEVGNFKIPLFDLKGNYLGTLQTIPEIMCYNTCKGLAVDSKGDIYIAKTNQIVKLTQI